MNLIRSILVPVLLILGAVATLTANATVWANRTVFNTDAFVATTNRVLDEQDVQEQLATRLSVRLIEQGQVEDRLSEELPDRLQILAPVLADRAQITAYNIILRLLQSEAVRSGLDTALVTVHEQVLHIIENEGAVLVEEDSVILDLGVIMEQAAAEFGGDRDGPLSNIELPPDAGQIVLVEDAETADAVQDLLALHEKITWAVIAVAAVAFALALLVAHDRRATLRTVGIVIAVCGLLAATLIVPLRPVMAAFAENDDASRAVFDAFFWGYRVQSLLVILLGVIVTLIGVLIGEGDLAIAVRRSVRPRDGEPSPRLREAIGNHATGLRLVGFFFAATILVAWPEPSTQVFVSAFVLIALYFTGLWVITGGSQLAVSARERTSALFTSPDASAPGAPFARRYANHLRIGGIVLAIIITVLIPDVGLGAIAGMLVLTFAYLALVDWLASRNA